MIAAADRRRSRSELLLLFAPLLACLAFALVHLLVQRPARLGDDWIYFHGFQHWPLTGADEPSALLQNGSAADGLRFRPFCYAWLWVEQRVFGSFDVSAWIGAAWIGTGALALNGWLRALGVRATRAALAGALFGLHPAHSEIWGWASARIDTMAAALGIAALWALARERRVLAACAFLAAFASKESAYPLAVLAPLVPLLRGAGVRRAAVDAGVAFGALAALFAAKYAALGAVFADSWGKALSVIPLTTMLAGWLSHLEPLLFDPLSTAADGAALRMRSASWLGVLIVAALLIPVLFVTSVRRQRLAFLARARRLAPLAAICALGYFGTIAVSFGVAALPDLDGGRLYFLPSAFVVTLLALALPRSAVLVCLLLGTTLLHANLTPYRSASAAMLAVEARIDAELADADTALRIRELPMKRGPVPLFVLMAEHRPLGIPVPDASKAGQAPSWPRLFLTWVDPAATKRASAEKKARESVLDGLWAEEMARRKHAVKRLRWSEGGLKDD